jgi:hypothetical protein
MSTKMTIETFFNQVNTRYRGKFTYLIDNDKFNGYKTIITVICPEHGPSEQKIKDHLRGHGCKKMWAKIYY